MNKKVDFLFMTAGFIAGLLVLGTILAKVFDPSTGEILEIVSSVWIVAFATAHTIWTGFERPIGTFMAGLYVQSIHMMGSSDARPELWFVIGWAMVITSMVFFGLTWVKNKSKK